MLADQQKNQVNNSIIARRKRVQRLKMLIIIGVIILLFTSVIMNLVLIFKVLHFEKQIHKLYSEAHCAVVQDISYIQ